MTNEDPQVPAPPPCPACQHPMALLKESNHVLIYRCEPCGIYHALTLEEAGATIL